MAFNRIFFVGQFIECIFLSFMVYFFLYYMYNIYYMCCFFRFGMIQFDEINISSSHASYTLIHFPLMKWKECKVNIFVRCLNGPFLQIFECECVCNINAVLPVKYFNFKLLCIFVVVVSAAVFGLYYMFKNIIVNNTGYGKL